VTILAETVYNITPRIQRVLEFKGLNKRAYISEGEMRDMQNLSSDEYPYLTQRKPRQELGWTAPLTECPYNNISAMLYHKYKLAVFEPRTASSSGAYRFYFWYGHEKVAVPTSQSNLITTDQQLVGFNDYIVFLPAGIMFNADAYNSGADADGKYHDADGNEVALWTNFANDTGLTNDSSTSPDVHLWIDGETTKMRFTASYADALSNFKAGDAVRISGKVVYGKYSSGKIKYKTYARNGGYVSCLVTGVESFTNSSGTELPNRILSIAADAFPEVTNTEESSDVYMTKCRVERVYTPLAYGMAYGNRIWGCSNRDNAIRCSKLGDPTNWEYFQGESLDSFVATQGTEQYWSGCAAYSNHLLFFKPRAVHKVYGSFPSEYQVKTQTAAGVERGSEKSIAIVNDHVFYKSFDGIMCYAGDRPELISEELADNLYTDAVAGADRRKYFVSMKRKGTSTYDMLVYDTITGLWHREDSQEAKCFHFFTDQLRFFGTAPEETSSAHTTKTTIWTCEGATKSGYGASHMEWYAELGPFDELVEDEKVISRLQMRYELQTAGAYFDVWLKCDSDEWELVEEIDDSYRTSGLIQIVPRRCDRYQVKIKGHGRVRIMSLARQYRARNYVKRR